MPAYDGSIKIDTHIDTDNANKGFNSIGYSMKSLEKGLSKIGSKLATIFGVTAIIRFSNEASQMATNTEASVQRLVDIYGEASNAVGDFIDSSARALGMSKSAAASYASVYGNLFSVWADQATNANLTNHYLNMTAVVASKTGRQVSDVQERIRSGLLGNTEAIEDLGIFVNVKTIEMTDAFKRMADGKSWEQLDAYAQQQIRTMAILEQATNKYGTEVAETSAMTRMQFNAAFEDFKNTWGQVVNKILLPILKVGTMVLNVLTKGLQTIAKLSGKTLDSTVSQSNAISSSVDNQNDLTDAVKGTNKELKKSLAGFDEINTLSQDSADGSGSTSSIGSALGLSELEGSLNGSSVAEEIDSTLTTIMGVVGLSLAALGMILICTGHIGWGLGFIIAGAALFAVTMATIQNDGISQTVKDQLTNAVILTGIVAVAIGILLCFAQKWLLGIGLIAIGVAAIVTAVALNWNGIKEKMQGTFGGVLALIGVVAIVIGILLCCAGIWPLGIGLIAVGATALVSVVVVNWTSIKTTVSNTMTSISDWIESHGFAMMILGILLCFTGAGIPIGLGLISKGVKGMVQGKDPVWNTIFDKLKETWGKIATWWDTKVAKYFTAAYWGQKGKDMINGLIKWVISGLNRLIDKINSFGFNLPDVLGGGRVGFNISKLSIPQLAQGTVLPGGKPFMAIVNDQPRGQTNIEAPLDTIKQAVAEVIAQINMNNNSSGNNTIVVPVMINGREILRAVREAESDSGKQTVFGGFANVY